MSNKIKVIVNIINGVQSNLNAKSRNLIWILHLIKHIHSAEAD